MPIIGSSLSKRPDGTPFINSSSLSQVAGLPKDLSRAAFDAAVTQERANIANNGTGIWSNGEKVSIFGELGTRLWSVGASGPLSHARNVVYQGQVYALAADANVFGPTSGAPASSVGANGDYMADGAAGLVYGPKASGAWPAGMGAVAVPGATPDSLAPASAGSLGTATIVATVGGIDQKTTGAAVVASQVTTINQLPVVSAPDLTDLIPLYDVSGNVTGRITLSSLQSLIGTSSGSTGNTGGGTTPANATTYSISTPSSGTAGTAQTVTVAVSGTLGSAVVVTPSDGASGTFGGTVTLAAGTNSSGTTQYTPASAGTVTITATNNGGLTNPAGVSVTVAAAASGGAGSGTGAVGGASNSTPMAMNNAAYTARGDGSGAQMLSGGNGQASITLPSNKAWFIKVKGRTTSNYNYTSTPYLVITDTADTTHQIKAAFNNRSLSVFDSDGGGGGNPGTSVSDGAIHDFTLEALSGGGENAYVDGASVQNGSHQGTVAIGGAATIYVAGDSNTTLVTGIFDVRVYAGSLAAPGALLYEWLLNGNGTAA